MSAALDFIATHSQWAGPIMFVLAFAESLVVVGLLVPTTIVLVGTGALIVAGALDFWVVLLWSIPGAALGDAVSYWLGRRFRHAVPRLWPLSNRPELLARGHRFFAKYGAMSVFLARFLGPLRAIVPLVAGIVDMPQWQFQVANVASAIVWVPLFIAPGALVGISLDRLAELEADLFTVVSAALAAAAVLAGFAWWYRARRRARATTAPAETTSKIEAEGR